MRKVLNEKDIGFVCGYGECSIGQRYILPGKLLFGILGIGSMCVFLTGFSMLKRPESECSDEACSCLAPVREDDSNCSTLMENCECRSAIHFFG